MSDIKQKTIEHYERMIEWSERQDGSESKSIENMFNSISEDWSGGCCPYCKKYKFSEYCKECELQSCECCDGLWHNMNNTTTWQEWITASKAVLGYIKENG